MLSSQFTNTVKTSVSTFSANLNNSIQLVNIYTIKGSNVAECHVFDIVDVWKLLYILNISVKSNNIEKAYITATLTAEGDDEFIFKLNNSYNMSLPSNAGSCMTCSACGNYTNFYKNSTKTFDVTQYLQDTNSIYVYFHNFTGGYSYKISNLEFTIKTYSKLQFTGTINVLLNKNSVSLKVKRLESLSFISALPRGACGQTASLNKSFKLSPYIEAGLIKSITVTSKFDDYGSASINGKGVGSCNLGVYQSCYNQTQTSVIDKSNLKNINSLSAYATSWNDPFGSCASNGNATSVYVTIKINYY